jgi:hypothetical protein
MCVVDIEMRLPPHCPTCNGIGWVQREPHHQARQCSRCLGRSADVEYRLIVWTAGDGHGWWLTWPRQYPPARQPFSADPKA